MEAGREGGRGYFTCEEVMKGTRGGLWLLAAAEHNTSQAWLGGVCDSPHGTKKNPS